MTDTASSDPQRFYTQTIPAQFNSILEAQERQGEAGRGVYEGMLAVNESIHVELRGADTQHFYLNVEAGRMTPGDAPDHDPFVHMILDFDSFLQLAREAGESLTALLGAIAGLGGEMKLTRKRVRDLEAVAGLIRFEVTGERGFALLTRFGSGPAQSEPDALIRMSDASYRELRAGRLDPQTAFLRDAIHAEGDLQKVMQLAFAAVAPD